MDETARPEQWDALPVLGDVAAVFKPDEQIEERARVGELPLGGHLKTGHRGSLKIRPTEIQLGRLAGPI
jgi:hypothetical protein